MMVDLAKWSQISYPKVQGLEATKGAVDGRQISAGFFALFR